MAILVIGLVLFLGIHFVRIVAPAWREARIARMGVGPWKGIYSAVSLLGLVFIVWGYAAARLDPVLLYQLPRGLQMLTALLMLPVFVLLLAAYLPGRIQSATKHPMLLAVKLWALSHLLVNGSLADVLLFGGFLIWAIAARVSVKHRVAEHAPAGRGDKTPSLPASKANDVIALAGGLVLYVVFAMWAHLAWIGVRPFSVPS